LALMRREHDSPVLLEGDGGFTLVDHLQLRSNRVKHNLQASNFIMQLQIYIRVEEPIAGWRQMKRGWGHLQRTASWWT
jgi:hypothetical protein